MIDWRMTMIPFDIEEQVTWRFENEISKFSLHYYTDDPETVYLFSLFVKEKYRKQGLGNAILEYAENYAKEKGFTNIMLKVESNSWMEMWYYGKGYVSFKTEEDYIWLKKEI